MFDVLQGINLKGHILQCASNILEKMADPSANRIQQGNIFQELPFFVDQQRSRRNIVLHLYFLDFRSILHGKRNFFRFQIPIRSQFFPERVCLAHGQPLDQMFLALNRRPTVHHVSFLVQNCQFCSGKLHAGGKVCLFHGDFGRFVFKIRSQFHHRNLLALVGCGHFHRPVRRNIPVRSRFLFDVITSKRQVIQEYRFPVLIG